MKYGRAAWPHAAEKMTKVNQWMRQRRHEANPPYHLTTSAAKNSRASPARAATRV